MTSKIPNLQKLHIWYQNKKPIWKSLVLGLAFQKKRLVLKRRQKIISHSKGKPLWKAGWSCTWSLKVFSLETWEMFFIRAILQLVLKESYGTPISRAVPPRRPKASCSSVLLENIDPNLGRKWGEKKEREQVASSPSVPLNILYELLAIHSPSNSKLLLLTTIKYLHG